MEELGIKNVAAHLQEGNSTASRWEGKKGFVSSVHFHNMPPEATSCHMRKHSVVEVLIMADLCSIYYMQTFLLLYCLLTSVCITVTHPDLFCINFF